MDEARSQWCRATPPAPPTDPRPDLLAFVAEVVGLFAADGTARFYSPALAAVLGYAPEDLLGAPGLALVHPDDQAAARETLGPLASGQAQAGPLRLRLRHADGSWRTAELRGFGRLDDPALGALVVTARDITEQARAEDQLRATAERFHRAAEHLPEVLAIYDPDGRYLFMNALGRQLSGLELPQILGQRDQDILPPAVTDSYLPLLERARQTHLPQRHQRTVPLPDGDYTVVLNYVPILDRDGRLAQVIGVTQDLTEHTRIQNELSRREAQMRAIFNNSTQAFVLLDNAGHILMFNPIATARMRVVSGRDLEIGASVYDYLRPPWGEDVAAGLDQALAGQSVSFERNMGTEQGPLWFSCDLTPIYAEGHGVIGTCVSALDTTVYHAAVSALARSEERWRALIQHASDGMLVVDAEGVLLFSSPALERILGYPLDQLIGVSTVNILHPDDRDQTRAARQQLLVSESRTETMTVRARHRDGRWVWLEAICVNLMANPNIGGVVVTVRDVTERRSLEAQLQHAQRMESIGRLAGGVAHDFNNLLTAILGNAELMLSELAPDHPHRADLELIQHTAERAAGLTRQLLAFARKQVLAPQPLDLNLVVGGMEQLLRRLIGSDVLLISGLAPDVPLVYADRSQIEQVLINLAVNARDAMPEGGSLTITTGLVEVGAEGAEPAPQQAPGRYVRLSVSDSGVGMSQEVLQHLFEPFFTTKAPGHGTGLGLATSYGIVRQHGGHIQVQSDLGCGTTVSIDLPAMVGPLEQRTPPDEMTLAPRGSETVLVVDDAPAVRTLVSRMLQSQGYGVLEASDGTQALALIASMSSLPDLLIADVVMPHMPGYALADLLTGRYPRLKVLLISGNADLSRGTQRQHALHYPVLHKPFGPHALAQMVRAVLDEPKQ